MTRETAKKNLKVITSFAKNLEFITAFANGEEIQYLASDGEWQDIDEPMFVQQTKYRVKPKRVFALYNPERHEFISNLESFNEQRILKMISIGWIKFERVEKTF